MSGLYRSMYARRTNRFRGYLFGVAIGEALMKYEVIDGDEVKTLVDGGEIHREVEKKDEDKTISETDKHVKNELEKETETKTTSEPDKESKDELDDTK